MAERKRPRRTRERILQTSLELFNALGEPHVTTADIAAEMNISPGNLYYHFRNKDEIVAELFAAHERDVVPLFAEPPAGRGDVEDLWLLLHLLLERMQAYRFFYRDLMDLTARYPRIGRRFADLVQQGERVLTVLCHGLRARRELDAADPEIAALARNAMLVVVYSTAFERIRRPGPEVDLGYAAYQVLTLIAPYLQGDARRLVERLSRDYL